MKSSPLRWGRNIDWSIRGAGSGRLGPARGKIHREFSGERILALRHTLHRSVEIHGSHAIAVAAEVALEADVLRLFATFALEVGAKGIRVNAVRPGFIHTEIHATGGNAAEVATAIL